MLRAFPAKYRWTLGAFLIVLAATWWRPLYPVEQALHHSLTVLGAAEAYNGQQGDMWDAQKDMTLATGGAVVAVAIAAVVALRSGRARDVLPG